jgi:hypothetical protein
MSGNHKAMRDAPQSVPSAIPVLFTESAAMEKEKDLLRTITAVPKTKGKRW